MDTWMTRRGFLGAAGALAAAACATGSAATSSVGRGLPGASLADGALVLFQGDSITDVGRNRNRTEPNVSLALGGGYAQMVAAELLRESPKRHLRFLNRGISGNEVSDLRARWERDALALRPDVLSILIGVNDFAHALEVQPPRGATEYEAGYATLLDETRRALPDVRLVVLEPFALLVGSVTERWFPAFHERRAIARRVADGAQATFVPLQQMFDDLARADGPDYWIADGIHPTPAGHAMIARRWRAAMGL